MKKIIGLCFVGLAVMGSVGCNDAKEEAKDVTGLYQYTQKESYSGAEKLVQVTITKDKKDYNIKLESSNYNSKELVNSYDWGSADVVDGFVVRKDDDKKVFEIVGDGLTRIDVKERPFMPKVEL